MRFTPYLTLTLLLGLTPAAAPAQPSAAPPGPAVRRFELTYEVTVDARPAGVKRLDVWIPRAPANEAQSLTRLAEEIGAAFQGYMWEETEKADGNRLYHFQPSTPDAFQITVRYQMERRAVMGLDPADAAPAPTPGESPDPRYLRPDRLGVVDDRVRKLAPEITAGRRGEVEQARAIYGYVLGHMAYDKSGTGWGQGDTLRACEVGRGNCTDFHALFMSLVRARGIPARFHMGALLPPDKAEGEIEGYHSL